MSNCALGDDVYCEDPTVNLLEKKGAKLLGKERALFVPSGTMANAIAIATHCKRGDEVICGNLSHIFNWEGGGASSLFGVSLFPVANMVSGKLNSKQLVSAIRPDDDHCAHTQMVVLENTHNMCGGKVLSPEYVEDMNAFCRKHRIILHMDGARLANASVALKKPMHTLAEPCRSVTLCLSKGLGAPVGSLLAGTESFITRARHIRKALGGGMRQAGIIAAAGLVALEDFVPQLTVDHKHAQVLAKGLSKLGFSVIEPESNIVIFNLKRRAGAKSGPSNDSSATKEVISASPDFDGSANIDMKAISSTPPTANDIFLASAEADNNAAEVDRFVKAMRKEGVLVGGARPAFATIRAVTHRNVNAEDIDAALKAFERVAGQL